MIDQTLKSAEITAELFCHIYKAFLQWLIAKL